MGSRKGKTALRTIPGVRIGHASDYHGLTGCTVILTEAGAVCGVDVRGSAAGTRELAPCLPGHLVERVHAIFLTGGSAFGLDAAAGVMQFLEARGVGFPAGATRVPIVPAAVIFDLSLGNSRARPDAGMAKWACQKATANVTEGSIGAGTGATVWKILGLAHATKGGVGFSSLNLSGEVMVQALAVVNAFGDVLGPHGEEIVAGARVSPSSNQFLSTRDQMLRGWPVKGFGATNTTLVAVITNAALDKNQATKVAQMAQDGLARVISPAHTQFDGDLVFALSLGQKTSNLNTLGTAAAHVTAQAILRGVTTAKGLGGIPSATDLADSAT